MTTRIIIKIKGMECSNCTMILERIEDKMKGFIMAEASHHKAQMIVEYDETQISEAQIEAEVMGMGFEVTSISKNSK